LLIADTIDISVMDKRGKVSNEVPSENLVFAPSFTTHLYSFDTRDSSNEKNL
jgi:hypothetical protein